MVSSTSSEASLVVREQRWSWLGSRDQWGRAQIRYADAHVAVQAKGHDDAWDGKAVTHFLHQDACRAQSLGNELMVSQSSNSHFTGYATYWPQNQ